MKLPAAFPYRGRKTAPISAWRRMIDILPEWVGGVARARETRTTKGAYRIYDTLPFTLRSLPFPIRRLTNGSRRCGRFYFMVLFSQLSPSFFIHFESIFTTFNCNNASNRNGIKRAQRCASQHHQGREDELATCSFCRAFGAVFSPPYASLPRHQDTQT